MKNMHNSHVQASGEAETAPDDDFVRQSGGELSRDEVDDAFDAVKRVWILWKK